MSDLIYKQDAKDAVDMALDTIDHVPEWVYDILLNSLDKVPSASPDLSEEDMRLIKKLRSFHNGSYAVVLDKLITSACNESKQQATGSSDCIYRKDAIDAIHEDADWLAAQGSDWQVERMERDKSILMSLPSAEKVQLSGEDATFDCISRQNAVKTMYDLCEDIDRESLHIDAIVDALENLQSVEPRKKGKWIYGEKSGQDGWYCSECGGFIPWYYDFYGLDNIDFIEDFKTCPFCDSKMVSYTGADMREGEEE